jgi:two-component system, NtrC family, response regulator GlrR
MARTVVDDCADHHAIIRKTASSTSPAEKISHDLTLEFGLSDLIGTSPRFQSVLREIRILAQADANVLISGETGTGKDMCARAIHYTGARASKPFLPINCGSVPEEILENEFFGHERGAYTDARERSTGLIAEADGGTLFLDDIDTLTPKNQSKLLRFLQTGSYTPLGGVREVHVDVRVIAATNDDLTRRIREHTFRDDLYYRLAVLTLMVPPLRDRVDDVPVLAEYLMKRYASRYGKSLDRLSDSALRTLSSYSWPGNVRELENTVHRAVIHAEGKILNRIDLPSEDRSSLSYPPLFQDSCSFRQTKKDVVDRFEKDYILHALHLSGGNISEAARRCGKNRRAFWELMRKHHLSGNSG